mmetsp:Transcript_9994/g.25801  ORF Transcript_9994/g.25801 Transcript_9994/m.25801 type:complete len:254 (+) Transcript_9994:721-1482(+)
MRGRVRSCEAWVGGCGRRRSIAVVGRLVVWVVRRWGGGCARRRLLWRRLLIAHGRGRRCARLRRVPGWRAVGRRRVGIVGVGSERRSIRVPRRWRAVAGRRCAIGRWWRRRVARGRRAVCRRWRIRRAMRRQRGSLGAAWRAVVDTCCDLGDHPENDLNLHFRAPDADLANFGPRLLVIGDAHTRAGAVANLANLRAAGPDDAPHELRLDEVLIRRALLQRVLPRARAGHPAGRARSADAPTPTAAAGRLGTL